MASSILEWNNLTFQKSLIGKGPLVKPKTDEEQQQQPKYQTILHQLCGHARQGELLGILGPSGSGKSVLLKCLAGIPMRGRLAGLITIDGHLIPADWNRSVALVKFEKSFQNMLPRLLTVLEVFQFYAALMGKEARIGSVIADLGLQTNNLASRRVGLLSDGEWRRLVIGIEMLQEPALLLLDEPTSGLDTATAASLIRTIAGLASRHQSIIIAALNQPSRQILQELTGGLMILAEGRDVFRGGWEEAIDHFTTRHLVSIGPRESPGDAIIDALTIDYSSEASRVTTAARVEELSRAWRRGSNHRRRIISRPPSVYMSKADLQKHLGFPLSWPREFFLLLRRHAKLFYRDRLLLPLLVGQALYLALLIGFTFFRLTSNVRGVQGRLGLLFTMLIYQLSIQSISVALASDTWRPFVRYEIGRRLYRRSTLLLSIWVELVPVRLVLTTVASLILYYLPGLRTDGFQYFLVFWATYVGFTLAALSYGLILSVATGSLRFLPILFVITYTIFVLYGGNLTQTLGITWILRWLQYASPVFYAYSALMQNEFKGNTFDGVPGEVYLIRYGLDTIPTVVGAIMPMVLALVFLAIAVGLFYRITRPKLIDFKRYII